MKRLLPSAFLLLVIAFVSQAQEPITLKKGIILDSLMVRDTVPETFSLYIPSSYDNSEAWPVIFVLDMKGNGREALQKFRSAAEKQKYLLAASNNLRDTLSISQNILISTRLMKTMADLLPILKGRVYMAGFGTGGKMAGITPFFIKEIEGIISIGAPLNSGLFLEFYASSMRNTPKFTLVGVVGREDHYYTTMLQGRKVLNSINFSNDLLIHDGGKELQTPIFIDRAVARLGLAAMRKGSVQKDSGLVARAFEEEYADFEQLMNEKRYPEAEVLITSMLSAYQTLVGTDSLAKQRRQLRRDKAFKTKQREFKNLIFKEELTQREYEYNLLQDLDALNYNNLGWWNFQMKKLREYENKSSLQERQMGKRLISFINALVEDNIDLELARPRVDEEAVSLLWMIKTITDPTDFSYYLKIISDSARYEDFGTAIFYLEELLKQGFTDKEALYNLENTALLRITPEFNELVEKYLNEARYKLNEE
jgi:hypothetical protein